MKLLGVDFTSAPTRKKPITCAWGTLDRQQRLVIDNLAHCETFDAFSTQLAAHTAWTGAFDFPFGLPRQLVEQLGWPRDWCGLIKHYTAMTRADIRTTFKAFCDARAAGNKFAHRACDVPAGSSPSMKWVNPPVAYMLHAGAPLLMQAGVTIPGLQHGDDRIVLEGYPGLLARGIIGKASYKSDDVVKQTAERTERRRDIIAALKSGQHPLLVKVRFACAQPKQFMEDASGDALDAVLCAVQAAWATQQTNYGLPPQIDPVEGWIVSAPWEAAGV